MIHPSCTPARKDRGRGATIPAYYPRSEPVFHSARAPVAIAIGIALGAAGVPATAAGGPGCAATSGPGTATLVELYTSEGCSSCPPADRWLSALVRAPSPTGPVVALAFHVDYWDYLGWRDRFARPAFTARQRERVAAGGGEVVYTPQVLVAGRDFRGWGPATALDRTVADARGRPAPAQLRLELSGPADDWRAQLDGAITVAPGDTRVWLAVYGDGLASRVTRGENRGRALRHDRVVGQLLGPFAPGPDGRVRAAVRVAPPAGVAATEAGVAAFAERSDGTVLQAVALAFCPD
jgi:hypothetical protein